MKKEIMIPKQLQQNELNFVLIEKGGKKPFQPAWQKKEIKYDDEELQTHLNSNGNYGVLGGGQNNLIIIDFDNKELQDKLISILPKTLTIKTGSGLFHLYYFSNKSDSFKIFDENLNTLADIQGKGKSTVISMCSHCLMVASDVANVSQLDFDDENECDATESDIY